MTNTLPVLSPTVALRRLYASAATAETGVEASENAPSSPKSPTTRHRHQWQVVWPWRSRGAALGVWYTGHGCWTLWFVVICLRRNIVPSRVTP